jgi:hypothetical protein
MYHYDGDELAKKMDIFIIYFASSICILISLYNKNIVPLVILLITGILYKYNNNSFLKYCKSHSQIKTPINDPHLFDNIYHTLIHIIAFIGTLTLIYNTKKI